MHEPSKYTPSRIASPTKRSFFHTPAWARRFLFPRGSGMPGTGHDTGHPWYTVLWLTGVDYFSTLAYQPGIALLAAGALSPLATLLLVVVTLFGAVPTYFQVARRSYSGQGSIAMLEKLIPGWYGKLFVLFLIGFAVTDFIITITLSAADATAHIVENPVLSQVFGHHPILITIGLLVLLAAVFIAGFSEALGVAAFVAIPFILLNVVVLARAGFEISKQPELIEKWLSSPTLTMDWTAMAVAICLVFPRLALGLSGFETGVSVMPWVRQKASHQAGVPPFERISGTRKLLLSAALIMSVLLLSSSFITTLLIDPELVKHGGPASGRAISYLTHKFFHPAFATVYDVSTIVILWFAGASALAALLSLIPRYLPRFGMAPRWVEHRRPLVILLFLICVAVTLAFNANVEAQAGAYATGVLVLITSAAFAVAFALTQEARAEPGKIKYLKAGYFWIVTATFVYTLVDNVIARPDGIIISSIFIVAILISSALSRSLRAYELRVESHTFADKETEALWHQIKGKNVNFAPISGTDNEALEQRKAKLHNFYKILAPLAFVSVNLRDDTSDFMSPLRIRIQRQGEKLDSFLIEVHGAVAIPNTIAYLSEQIDPIAIYLGLARKNAMEQALSYLLLGEGEIGVITYKVLIQYWADTPEDDVRPLVFLLSE